MKHETAKNAFDRFQSLIIQKKKGMKGPTKLEFIIDSKNENIVLIDTNTNIEIDRIAYNQNSSLFRWAVWGNDAGGQFFVDALTDLEDKLQAEGRDKFGNIEKLNQELLDILNKEYSAIAGNSGYEP